MNSVPFIAMGIAASITLLGTLRTAPAAFAAAGLLVLGAGPAPAAGLERHEAATAVTDEVQTAVTTGEVGTIITVAKAAYSAYQLFAGGDMSVREATRQILNAIYSVRHDGQELRQPYR